MGGIPDLPTRNPAALPQGAEMLAEAPAPAPAPAAAAVPEPQDAAGFQSNPNVQPDDSRHETGWVIIADMVLGGAMPWLMAAVDVAQGRVQEDGFDAARQEHQTMIEAMKENHPDFVKSAENAMPFLAGLGFGALKGPSTVAGAAGRGAMAGGAMGTVQGFTSGPKENPSAGSERVGNAFGGGMTGAAMGAAGGAVAGGVQKGLKVRADKKAASEQAAIESRNRYEETQKGRREARIAEDNRKEQESREKETQNLKKSSVKPQDLRHLWKTKYVKMPKDPPEYWRDNQKAFNDNPEDVFYQAADKSPSLDVLSKALNMPPAVIASRLSNATLELNTPARRKLFSELADVEQARGLIRRDIETGRGRGKKVK